MTLIKLSVILIFFFTLQSCKKGNKLTQFNMEYNETVVIPSSAGVNLPFNVSTPDVQSNSESTFEINDTRKDLIEEIKLTQLDLTLTSPTNGDFGFLKSIEIYISADGLSEKIVARNTNIPSNIGKYLELETSDIDLQEYIKKDQFSLRLNTVTDELITADHEIDIHSIFFVDAKIFGQ